jgi:hypothetical protein
MKMADVRPRHVRELVRELRLRCGPGVDQLAPRTVRHIYATTRTMFNDAVADEHLPATPCVLKRGELPKEIDKDPTWRAGALKDNLRFATHGPTGDIMDVDTSMPWPALCAEIAKLRIELREGKVIPLRQTGTLAGGSVDPATSPATSNEPENESPATRWLAGLPSGGEYGTRTRGLRRDSRARGLEADAALLRPPPAPA